MLFSFYFFVFLGVYKSCAAGGRSHRGFFFLKKDLLISVSSYVKKLVFIVRLFVSFSCYCFFLLFFFFFFLCSCSCIFGCIQVLCCGWTLPQGLFFLEKTPSYICFFLCEKTCFYCSFICLFFLLFFMFMFIFLFLFLFLLAFMNNINSLLISWKLARLMKACSSHESLLVS